MSRHLYLCCFWMSLSLSAALLGFSSSPTWIAVVDQIHEPWLLLIGEDGQQLEVHRSQCEEGLNEGSWVLYHSGSLRVTRLMTEAQRRYALSQERELRERLARLKARSGP